jgi:hypothetical protein
MDRFMEISNQNFEMMMQQRMMDQMESMEEKQERREERNERRQMQREMRDREMNLFASQHPPLWPYSLQPPQPPFASSPEYSSKPSQLLTPSTDPRTPTSQPSKPTGQATAAIIARPSRTSSPIDTAEEDANILTSFFIWKLQSTRNVARYVKWEKARDIIMENDWSIRDLQAMEDGTSAMYNRAIQAGISDGFARGFREELHGFKEVYRRQQGVQEAEAIQALNTLNSAI